MHTKRRRLKCRYSGVKRKILDERYMRLTLVLLQRLPSQAHKLIARYEDLRARVTLTSWGTGDKALCVCARSQFKRFALHQCFSPFIQWLI